MQGHTEYTGRLTIAINPVYSAHPLSGVRILSGGACSRPRQWKHGRELARLAAKT